MSFRPPNAGSPVDRTAGASEAPAADRFWPLFALSAQAGWVYDLATLRFLAVNDAAVRDYGWTREEFLQITLRDIRLPTELGRFEGQVGELGKEEHSTVSLHRTKSGAMRHVEISSYPLEFEGH